VRGLDRNSGLSQTCICCDVFLLPAAPTLYMLLLLMHPVVIVIIGTPCIAVSIDADRDDILHQLISSSELAEQVKLMRLVCLIACCLSFVFFKE